MPEPKVKSLYSGFKLPPVTKLEVGQAQAPPEKAGKALAAPVQLDKEPAPAIRRYLVSVFLSVDVIEGEPGVGRIRSRLSDTRDIAIILQKNNGLVSRALERADALGLKFYVALLLSEYIYFWRRTEEGRSIHKALKQAAGILLEPRHYWSAFASQLAASPLLEPIGKLPIYGPASQPGPFQLFSFEVLLRVETQILGWQLKPRRESGDV